MDLAVLHAETAQIQVGALRAELADLHQRQARRDVEIISALTRLAAVFRGLDPSRCWPSMAKRSGAGRRATSGGDVPMPTHGEMR